LLHQISSIPTGSATTVSTQQEQKVLLSAQIKFFKVAIE
jgi:hypothetical protein